jgi:hypothetical protein
VSKFEDKINKEIEDIIMSTIKSDQNAMYTESGKFSKENLEELMETLNALPRFVISFEINQYTCNTIFLGIMSSIKYGDDMEFNKPNMVIVDNLSDNEVRRVYNNGDTEIDKVYKYDGKMFIIPVYENLLVRYEHEEVSKLK